MLEGEIHHEDFGGHSGKIGPGDIQWMTAGKGIVHAEMPGSYNETSKGFQLWINLPSSKKMVDPRYQEHLKKDLPVFTEDGVKVIVVAGQYKGTLGKISPESTACFYDIHLQPGAEYSQKVFDGWQGLIFPYKGDDCTVNNEHVERDNVAVFKGNGENITIKNTGDLEMKFIMLYGKPIREPVAKHGPFVMNTEEEIYNTFEDY